VLPGTGAGGGQVAAVGRGPRLVKALGLHAGVQGTVEVRKLPLLVRMSVQ